MKKELTNLIWKLPDILYLHKQRRKSIVITVLMVNLIPISKRGNLAYIASKQRPFWWWSHNYSVNKLTEKLFTGKINCWIYLFINASIQNCFSKLMSKYCVLVLMSFSLKQACYRFSFLFWRLAVSPLSLSTEISRDWLTFYQ